MKVVVVGGTGNISTGIVKALLKFGHEVAVFTRGRRPSSLPPGVRYLQGDRRNYPSFETQMQAEKFEAAIDMISFHEEDARSAIRAFQSAKHFLHCSTVCTYGGPLAEIPATENCPLRPITDYGRGKVQADAALLQAHRDGIFPVTLFKPAHTFGPAWPVLRQLGWDYAWIDRLRKRKPIIVSGDGCNLWSVLTSDDAGLGFAAALGQEKCFGQTYNITHPKPFTWDEYHQAVAQALDCPIEIVHVPADLLLEVCPQRCSLLQSQSRWNQCYSVAKLQRDVPEFKPHPDFAETVRQCVAGMEARNELRNSDEETWEDEIISGLRSLAKK